MISPSDFRDLVSGRRRGLVAALLRVGLRVGEFGYSAATRWRNHRFDTGKKEIHRAEVPVICVGNLTVGGTGKTPLVEWTARQLRKRDVRVAILSRGYGAEQGSKNDEALELELALPDVPHLQNPDRVASAAIAVEELTSQLLLLDDGFQHRRLARDLDIVLLDASEPFGYDHQLPRGTLRESVNGLQRAQVVVLSRADMLDEHQRAAIRERAANLSPDSLWCEVVHQPAALLSATQGVEPVGDLSQRRVVAFCGIGNPAGFRHTLAELGCEPVGWHELPDHHDYTREDVEHLERLTSEHSADLLLCTRKDLVKLRVDEIGQTPLRALGVELKFLAGENELVDLLARIAKNIKREEA
ncbi:tetraacyldisaccharide 4'-kinase [Adhaeretor mobilis]|uniref:Tetraacyldisaccharide 4'-kinase n=1 Tax=Adhaeretor mobilis TaxID=1930276 RepID=A0A517N172_9BACT|nr:tetraacyldisaccharide 4'-kinase [Adhaeretor mobilis]QDT00768.1 Tetraacyldisaccharide 4'-kinase [Adhaeretor mobilis]